MSEKELSDEERFQLDRPPEEEPDPDESNDPTWEQLTEGYVQSNSRAIISLNKQVAKLEARMREKKSCDHPQWVRDPKSGDYICEKCGISVTDMFAETTRIPSMSEKKEPTVTMSLKSWDNLDKDLSRTEHHLISVLTNIRLIRGRMYKSMKQCLEGQLDENLAKVANLEESVKGLREMADEIKAEGEKKQDE